MQQVQQSLYNERQPKKTSKSRMRKRKVFEMHSQPPFYVTKDGNQEFYSCTFCHLKYRHQPSVYRHLRKKCLNRQDSPFIV
ncbi:unnamed protein product [Acanthoscelides obtectus]|uniref:Uncharacterized protein n=1 Tax=Acanthoscelides obtectus TaxID=200917 RepID=A0A9P0JZB8_ACAOB|nr:unnamed protein product [Acanthoscelides obtectus]CAK1669661.1 hypothetical protein AOBTE_LOCUS27142 [Acanthoscelides obtectus]